MVKQPTAAAEEEIIEDDVDNVSLNEEDLNQTLDANGGEGGGEEENEAEPMEMQTQPEAKRGPGRPRAGMKSLPNMAKMYTKTANRDETTTASTKPETATATAKALAAVIDSMPKRERALTQEQATKLVRAPTGGKMLKHKPGLGNAGMKRHGRKTLRTTDQGITKPAIRRLARRGGVKRLSSLVYEETRGVLRTFLEKVIRDAVIFTEHAKRKTVTSMDVVYSLKRNGRTLYGFDA